MCDASYEGIGVVLCVYRDRVEMPTEFFSRQLKEAETRYPEPGIECLTIVNAVCYPLRSALAWFRLQSGY